MPAKPYGWGGAWIPAEGTRGREKELQLKVKVDPIDKPQADAKESISRRGREATEADPLRPVE